MGDLLHSLKTELRRGSLTLAVLSQLKNPQYGYSLVQRLDQYGMKIDQSTPYKALLPFGTSAFVLFYTSFIKR